MAKLGEIAKQVRSKNAGPFWLTIDIFCANVTEMKIVSESLPKERIATLYDQSKDSIEKFEIPELCVLKISMPRPVVQGSKEDRDMHAAQFGWVLAELELNT